MGIPAALGVSASGLPPLNDQANAVSSGVISAIGPTIPFAFRGPMDLSLWASVNTTLTTTAGSLSATVASATGLAIGNAINSTKVPAGTTIGNLSGTTVTLAVPPICLPSRISTPNFVSVPDTTGLLGATVTVPSTAERTTLPANTTVALIVTPSIPSAANGTAGSWGVVQLSASFTTSDPLSEAIPLNFARTANAVTSAGADAAATFTGAAINFSATIQIERSFDGGKTWIVASSDRIGTIAQFTTGTPVSITFGEPEKNVLYRLNCIAYTSGTVNYRISQTGGAAESLAVGPLSNG